MTSCSKSCLANQSSEEGFLRLLSVKPCAYARDLFLCREPVMINESALHSVFSLQDQNNGCRGFVCSAKSLTASYQLSCSHLALCTSTYTDEQSGPRTGLCEKQASWLEMKQGVLDPSLFPAVEGPCVPSLHRLRTAPHPLPSRS